MLWGPDSPSLLGHVEHKFVFWICGVLIFVCFVSTGKNPSLHPLTVLVCFSLLWDEHSKDLIFVSPSASWELRLKASECARCHMKCFFYILVSPTCPAQCSAGGTCLVRCSLNWHSHERFILVPGVWFWITRRGYECPSQPGQEPPTDQILHVRTAPSLLWK